jgi:2,3,4,5-tetrahydropyridine-2,6-dicarboxylate N-succinyltransferase
MNGLKTTIIEIYEGRLSVSETEFKALAGELINGLNSGKIRSAECDEHGKWDVNLWVKYGILLLFRHGKLRDMSINNEFKYFDKDTLNLHPVMREDNIRLVPGGSSIRNGCYVAPGVICMPPMYINIGSYVDEGTMIDSHALVGTCAQLGKRIHLSAASQIGGVLEPAGARPVIVEDDVMIGGNCGIYEGTLVRKRAVLGSGVILTASTKVYDLVNERIIQSTKDSPLEIPESAVIIPGSRQVKSVFGKEHGLSIASPMIIKYRDEKTDGRTALEEALR